MKVKKIKSVLRKKILGTILQLVPLKKRDYSKKYIKWLNDPEVNKYLETRFVKQNKKKIKNFLKEIEKDKNSILFGIYCKKKKNHIGNIKLGPVNWNHKYGDISYFIGNKNYWNKGYASEAVYLVTKYAFKVLNLNKCLAGVYSSNVASSKVLKKVGYKLEGKLRSQYQGIHKKEDRLIYGILKYEFLRKKK